MNISHLITFAAGAATTGTVWFIRSKLRTIGGTLKIDRSNPDKDVYKLEVDDLGMLSKKKEIVFRVEIENIQSRE